MLFELPHFLDAESPSLLRGHPTDFAVGVIKYVDEVGPVEVLDCLKPSLVRCYLGVVSLEQGIPHE